MTAESRIGASAELGGEPIKAVGTFWGGRAYALRDIDARLSLGIEAAWANAGWSSTLMDDIRGRQKGRALVFFALRTPPGRAEAAIAAGFGLGAERRAREHPDGTREWLAIVPSFAAGAWASGRVWLTSHVGFEIEAGVLVTREPNATYGTSKYRAIVAPVGRGGVVVRF